MDEHEWTYLPGILLEMYFAERKKGWHADLHISY